MRQIRIYKRCPEIRDDIRLYWFIILCEILSVGLLSPLILLGLICAGLAWVLELMSLFILAFPSKIMSVLKNYKQKSIKSAHSKLAINEIRARIGEDHI